MFKLRQDDATIIRSHIQLAQVIVGKIRQLIGADVTVGEQPRVLFEAEVTQPTLDQSPMAVSRQCH